MYCLMWNLCMMYIFLNIRLKEELLKYLTSECMKELIKFEILWNCLKHEKKQIVK